MSLMGNLLGVGGPQQSGGILQMIKNIGDIAQKYRQFSQDPVGSLLQMNPNLQIPQNIMGNPQAVAPTGTAGEISVAYSIAGATDPGSVMQVTPAAVSEFWNVSCAKSVSIFRNCCQTVTITNTSDQPIVMQNANLILLPPGSLFN